MQADEVRKNRISIEKRPEQIHNHTAFEYGAAARLGTPRTKSLKSSPPSTGLGILGRALLLLDSITNGIIVLAIAFLISPIGLPMVAVWMIGQMQRFRYFVQDVVYG